MTIKSEGRLTFTFPDEAHVGKVDDWAFYRRHFSKIQETKAVDFVCVHGSDCWLIEVKDYRFHLRIKHIDLRDEVAAKARDTLAGLAAARRNANVEAERDLARRALRATRWRVALHLEERETKSRLYSGASYAADFRAALKRVLKGIDPHPVVGNIDRPGGPWSVASGSRNA